VHPSAQAMLVWMSQSDARLRELLDEEAAPADDLSPIGDASIVAHLRFLGEALSAHAAPGDEGLESFGERLPSLLAEREELHAHILSARGEAHAFEAGKQFGEVAGDDPSNQQVIERRVRLEAWFQVFLDALDGARGGEPVTEAVNAWMIERQTQLADLIFALDRRAKEIERDRGGEQAISDPDTVNRIGQAATVRAYSRFALEALAENLD